MKDKTTILYLFLIVVLGFAVYANSLFGEFIWDDAWLVRDNSFIKSWSNIFKIFTKGIGVGAGGRFYFYRPIQLFTYLIDYTFWELNVIGYHLSNMLFHILTALAIFWLINIIFKDRMLSLFTGILFIVHPVHTESVSYISGRADILAALFMLTCLVFYIKGLRTDSRKIYLLVIISYIFALLSKENSLFLPLILLLYHYVFKKKIDANKFLPFLILTPVYIIFRLTYLKSVTPQLSTIPSTFFQRVPGFFVALTAYIRLLLLPLHLHMEYGNHLFQLNNPKALLGILFLFLLLAAAFFARKNNKLVFFSISFFFITLLPNANLYPLNAYMAEHWLYLPSIGFFLILAKGLSSLAQYKNLKIAASGLTVFLAVFYLALTINQNNYWRESIAFYERTLKYAPDSARVHNNLGRHYYWKGEKEKSIELYKKAMELDPTYLQARYNLALAYKDIGMEEESIELYKKVIAMSKRQIDVNPDYADAYNSLGGAYVDTGNYDEAIPLFKKAIEINPNYASPYSNLAIIYSKTGKRDEAIKLNKKAIELNPNHTQALNNLGTAYNEVGRIREAADLFERAIEIEPDYAEAHYNLGISYNALGNKEKALEQFKKAVELKDDYIDAYNNLGVMYYGLGKKQEALEIYEKIIEINPNFAVGYNNLGKLYNDLGRNNEAIKLFKKATELDPSYATAYMNLAIVYISKQEYKSAIENCDKAIKLGYKVAPDFLQRLKPYR